MQIHNIPFYLKQVTYLFPMLLGYLLSFFRRKGGRMKNVWLLMERGFDAQDNAWHLMKYLHLNCPEIDAHYAIEKCAVDRNNLHFCEKSIVDYGSIKYYVYLYNATVIISTHIGTYFPSLWLKGKLENSVLAPKAKFVFLQHGILHNDIPYLHYSHNKQLKLFICGAKNEYDLVCSRYHYPRGIVQYTGLARFDNLYNFKTNRSILIMPTWRIKYKYYSDAEFKLTDYYQAYHNILTDQRLKHFLINKGYRIVFINHVEFQRFNHLFNDINDKNVEILSFKSHVIQDLLKTADVLVTDYSSIYYDFIYMRKPVIFYHINKELFYDGQYGEDFDNVSDFGLVASSEQEVIDMMISLVKEDCSMNEKYLSNMNRIFPIHDQCNCKRIVDAIINI